MSLSDKTIRNRFLIAFYVNTAWTQRDLSFLLLRIDQNWLKIDSEEFIKRPWRKDIRDNFSITQGQSSLFVTNYRTKTFNEYFSVLCRHRYVLEMKYLVRTSHYYIFEIICLKSSQFSRFSLIFSPRNQTIWVCRVFFLNFSSILIKSSKQEDA